MMARTPFLPLCLPVLAALLCLPAPAHADWFDNMFTFRKDQKPLVIPHNAVGAPRTVNQPYYPSADHMAWSNFYTRDDLVPEDYLSSSASKVMRPRPPEATPGGWQMIVNRNAANQRAADSHITIGEPDTLGDQYLNPNDKLGRKTQIGLAVSDWRKPGDTRPALNSRPGDFDYRAPMAVQNDGMQGASVPGGGEVVSGGGFVEEQDTGSGGGGTVTFSHDPRYVARNAKGEVTRYQVQGGDTLGSISAQKAIYGNWKLWPLIYSANRKAIGGSPDNLHVKQNLAIPRGYSAKQAKDAEKRAVRHTPASAN